MAAINFYQRCNQLQNSHIAYKLPSDIQETAGIRGDVYSDGRRASSSLVILNGRIWKLALFHVSNPRVADMNMEVLLVAWEPQI